MLGVAGGFFTYGQSARSVRVGGGVGDSEAAVGVDGPRRGLVYAWVKGCVRRAGVDEDFEVWTRLTVKWEEPGSPRFLDLLVFCIFCSWGRTAYLVVEHGGVVPAAASPLIEAIRWAVSLSTTL